MDRITRICKNNLIVIDGVDNWPVELIDSLNIFIDYRKQNARKNSNVFIFLRFILQIELIILDFFCIIKFFFQVIFYGKTY